MSEQKQKEKTKNMEEAVDKLKAGLEKSMLKANKKPRVVSYVEILVLTAFLIYDPVLAAITTMLLLPLSMASEVVYRMFTSEYFKITGGVKLRWGLFWGGPLLWHLFLFVLLLSLLVRG